ncbi:MAG: HAD hydrolase family protein, partial [Myxococcota bacterium]
EPDEVRAALHADQVTGVVAIDAAAKLGPLTAQVQERHGAVLSLHLNDDYYFREFQWLTIHAAAATKGHGIGVVRSRFVPECDRLVVFGDQTNDLPMFEVADHAVAVANADPAVKSAADEIIGPHHADAVVTWLEAHAG